MPRASARSGARRPHLQHVALWHAGARTGGGPPRRERLRAARELLRLPDRALRTRVHGRCLIDAVIQPRHRGVPLAALLAAAAAVLRGRACGLAWRLLGCRTSPVTSAPAAGRLVGRAKAGRRARAGCLLAPYATTTGYLSAVVVQCSARCALCSSAARATRLAVWHFRPRQAGSASAHQAPRAAWQQVCAAGACAVSLASNSHRCTALHP